MKLRAWVYRVVVLGVLASTGCLGASHRSSPSVDTTSSVAGSRAVVPKVTGLPVLDAAARPQLAGFAVTVPAFSLSSQTPQPAVRSQSPRAGALVVRGRSVSLQLESRCCIGSPAVSITRPLLMPDVVGRQLDIALRQVRDATGFFQVSLPAATAARRPLLGTYRVAMQWPPPGVDLRHQAEGFRLPLLVASR